MDDKPQNYTEKASLCLTKKIQEPPFSYCISDYFRFKANFILHVKNTSPPALFAHAANYASHIKRGFISSAFIYPIIYHRATVFKDNMYLLTEDGPKSQSWLT